MEYVKCFNKVVPHDPNFNYADKRKVKSTKLNLQKSLIYIQYYVFDYLLQYLISLLLN